MNPEASQTDQTTALQPFQFQPKERRTGKVARLPESIRDQINTMIQDGVPYLQIIERLGTVAQGLPTVEAVLVNYERWSL
jgi:hypothetical protein